MHPLISLLPMVASAQELKNPLGEEVNTISKLVDIVLTSGFFPFLGVVALVSVLWGAFQWITAGGSKERIQLGRNTILWVALGLLLAFSGFVLLQFLLQVFLNIAKVEK